MAATRMTDLSRLSWTVPHFCGRAFAGLAALWHQFAPSRQGCASSNQAGAALISHVRPCPLNEDDQAVAEADEKQDVHEEPRQPCHETRNVDLAEFSDGRSSANGSQAPFVPVVEGSTRLSARSRLNLPADELGDESALLDRDWSDAGQHLSVLVFHGGQIADHKNFRPSGKAEIRLH